MTQTLYRTGHVTQQLVIMLWTVGPAITQVVSVQTNRAVEAAVKTRTCHVFTRFLVLVVHAVVSTIAPSVDRETVVVTRTAVVGLRTFIIWTDSLRFRIGFPLQSD